MLGVVLPIAIAGIDPISAVDLIAIPCPDAVPVEIIVVVNVDGVVTTPAPAAVIAPTAAPDRAHGDPNPK